MQLFSINPFVILHQLVIGPKIICVLFLLLNVNTLLTLSFTSNLAQNSLEKKTKICADQKCKDDLFPTFFKRDYPSQDSQFLQAVKDDNIKVYAFEFSNRPDLMEAETADGHRGLIYKGHIDLLPYVIFLESALKRNQTLYVVDYLNGKLIREMAANPELTRVYIKYAKDLPDYQLDKDLVAKLIVEPQHSHEHHSGHDHHHQHLNNNEETEKIADEKSKAAVKPEIPEKPKKAVEDNQKEKATLKTIKEKESNEFKEITPSNDAVAEPDAKVKTREQNSEVKLEPAGIEIIEEKLKKQQEQMMERRNEDVQRQQQREPIKEEEKKKVEGILQQNKIETENASPIDAPPIEKEKPKSQQLGDANVEKEVVPVQIAPIDEQIPLKQQHNNTTMNPSEESLVVEQQPVGAAAKNEEILTTNTEQSDPNKLEKKSDEHQNPVPLSVEDPILNLKTVVKPQEQQQPVYTTATPQTQNDRIELQPANQGQGQIDVLDAASVPKQEQQQHIVEMMTTATETPKNDRVVLQPANEGQKDVPDATSFPTLSPNEIEFSSTDRPNPETTISPSVESSSPQPRQVVSLWDNIHVASSDSPTTELPQIPQTITPTPIQYVENIPADPIITQSRPPINVVEGRQEPNYCYQDDCKKLDDLPTADTNKLDESKLRKMFHESMSSIRSLLPEPLCHFEDTGLIVLAFVIISALLHLTNMLLSKTPGPEPFDHRLLHDCITRLKEQELIIGQLRAKAAENQRCIEVAKSAEHLQERNKTLEIKLEKNENRVKELEHNNDKLKNTLKSVHQELDQHKLTGDELRKLVDSRDTELKNFESEKQRLEAALDDAIAKLAHSQNRGNYLDTDLKEANAQLSQSKMDCEQAQREVEKWRNECAEKKAEVDELLNIIAELNNAKSSRGASKRGSSAEVDEAPDEKKSKKGAAAKEKKNGDNGSSSPDSSPGQLLDVAELDGDNGVGSGGSAGWSDLGDGIEVGVTEAEAKEKIQSTKPKTKVDQEKAKRNLALEEKAEEQQDTKLLDILEMAKLKGRLRSLETEREQLKFSLKIEREEKENVQKELNRLRQELVERERDSEQRELDRHGLTQQCTKLLQMIEEKEKKVEHCEIERERLRTRLTEVDLELRRVEDDKREAQHRLTELEQMNKQAEDLCGKLENKHYHEARRLQSKIRQLEEQLTLAKSSLSPLNMSGGGMSSDLNMSGNSSDRDFIPLNSPEGAAAGGERSGVPSLWSEIDTSEPVEELVSIERQSVRRRRSIRKGDVSRGSARESPFLADMIHVNPGGGLEDRMNSSKYSVVSAATGGPPRQRMRSRSVGRQSARLTGVSSSTTNPFFGTIGPSAASIYTTSQRYSVVPQSGKNSPYRQVPERPHSAARLRNSIGTGAVKTSTGAAGAYSSDSNGASSPPPEMPLLSGVPPPGLNRRPAVVCPPKLNVQLHKPAAK